MSDYCTPEPVTIAAGQSLSGAARIGDSLLVGIHMPAGWDAASLTFQASLDGVTYNNMYDKLGAEVSIPTAAGRYIMIEPKDFAGVQYLKVRSGTSGVPVNQAAGRTINLMVRPA